MKNKIPSNVQNQPITPTTIIITRLKKIIESNKSPCIQVELSNEPHRSIPPVTQKYIPTQPIKKINNW